MVRVVVIVMVRVIIKDRVTVRVRAVVIDISDRWRTSGSWGYVRRGKIGVTVRVARIQGPDGVRQAGQGAEINRWTVRTGCGVSVGNRGRCGVRADIPAGYGDPVRQGNPCLPWGLRDHPHQRLRPGTCAAGMGTHSPAATVLLSAAYADTRRFEFPATDVVVGAGEGG